MACDWRSTGVRTERSQIDKPTSQWVIDMNNYLRDGPNYKTRAPWTIYRVPSNMCNVHRNAYIPKLISIGPFHYRDSLLHVMEEHKKRYLLRLLERTSQEKGEQPEGSPPQVRDTECLESLVEAMKVLERKTRDCYSENFNIDSHDFVQMMVIDGCFVIELLRLYHKVAKQGPSNVQVQQEKVDDPIFTTRWMLITLRRDLLMLENQLPFFVLEKLFNLTSSSEEVPLKALALEFFDHLKPGEKKNQEANSEIVYDHLLHLFYASFLPSEKYENCNLSLRSKESSRTMSIPRGQERQLKHCVTELQDARVEFNMRKHHDVLDIKFRNRVLEIPPLYINDDTVPLLLNFVAYEQCKDVIPYFTNYFMFFDSLINSASDVEILHKNGIINHVLGSDEDVANLFNKLCREIVYDVDDCHLVKQMEEVNEYFKMYNATKWHDWWTKLIRDYFSSPWTQPLPFSS